MIKDIDKVNPIKRDMVRMCAQKAGDFFYIKRLIIFGSSLTNECNDESDIDICFDIDDSVSGNELFHMASEINKICDDNCDRLYYHKTSGKIKDEIDKKGVCVYERI